VSRKWVPDLDELERLLADGGDWPWHVWDRGVGWEVHIRDDSGRECSWHTSLNDRGGSKDDTFSENDARLVAAAINALPALINEVRAARLRDPPVTPETETDVTRVAPMPAAILEVIRELPESGTPMTREAKDNLVRTIAGLIDIYYPPDPEADS
jgi:hypothetical protein